MKANGVQPVVNPAHTHIQVMLVGGASLFFPIHIHDATKAVEDWRGGLTVVSLRPADGSAFHVNTASILFLRQVDEDTARAMVTEQNEVNEQRRRQAEAQASRAAMAARGIVAP